MKPINSFMLIVITISLCECRFPMEDIEYPWYVQNYADYSIGTYFASGIPAYYDISPTAYPDITLPIDSVVIVMVKSNEKQLVWRTLDREKLIKSLPADTLSVFIFHADTLSKYQWEEIRLDYKILRRYDLSLQNLKQLNFTIPCPPDERMENMKMYPPYEN